MALVLESSEIKIGGCSKFLVEFKIIDGKQFIDVRKWVLFPGSSEWMPTKKGICLELHQWKQAIEKMEELLSANMQDKK